MGSEMCIRDSYSGMEMGEYVAFPYGVKEGAPTEVKNLSDLYQNY